MTTEEWFSVFDEKYGDAFNWSMIPFSDHSFVEELLSESGHERPGKAIFSIAKCASDDSVLFLVDHVFRIYHLTYTKDNTAGFPRCLEFQNLTSVMNYIEKEFLNEYI